MLLLLWTTLKHSLLKWKDRGEGRENERIKEFAHGSTMYRLGFMYTQWLEAAISVYSLCSFLRIIFRIPNRKQEQLD